MFLILLIFTIWFVLFYWIEGQHDAHLILESQQAERWKDQYNANFHKGMWHKLDSYEKALVHVTASFFLFCINEKNIYLFFSSLFYSLSLRMMFHDMFINIYRGVGINFYGTKDGKWDWWDGLLLNLKDKGISQYVFKGSIILICLRNDTNWLKHKMVRLVK